MTCPGITTPPGSGKSRSVMLGDENVPSALACTRKAPSMLPVMPAVIAAVSSLGGTIVPVATTPRVNCASATASTSAETLASNGIDADWQLMVVLNTFRLVWLTFTGKEVLFVKLNELPS